MSDATQTGPPGDATHTAADPGATTPHGEKPGGESRPIPGYELLETLGEGGMGVVWKARQTGLNRVVALKLISSGRAAKPHDMIRFLAEAESVAAVKHPNVVQVFEYGEADGVPFLAMEYVGGGSLAELLKAGGPLPARKAVGVIASVADGVQAAHDQGIVHRDLKPANILLAPEPKISDFGLAKKLGGSDLTRTQAVMGTPAYMAPEQAKGRSKFAGPAADIWALGVILFEALAGRRPFEADDPLAILKRVVDDDPPPLPGVPRDLELVCRKCLAKEPGERYASAAAVAADLRAWSAGQPVSVRAPGLFERTAKWVRRNPVATGLIASLTFGFAAAASLGLYAREEADRADTAASDAKLSEAAAVRNAAAALAAKDAAERLTGYNLINLAQRDYDRGDVPAALAKLDAVPENQRFFEWKLLGRLYREPGIFTLRAHGQEVRRVLYSPNEKWLVTQTSTISGEENDLGLKVWDARTGRLRHSIPGLHTDQIAFLPDRPADLLIARPGGAEVWSIGSAKLQRRLHGLRVHPAYGGFAVSPDGRRVAYRGGDDGRTLRVFDLGREVFDQERLEAAAKSRNEPPVFSADGSLSVLSEGWLYRYGHNDSVPPVTVLDFDRPSGRSRQIRLFADNTGVVAFAPDDRHLAYATDDQIQVFDTLTRRLVNRWDTRYGPTAAAYAPDGRKLAVGTAEGRVMVYDAVSGELRDAFRSNDQLGRDGPNILSNVGAVTAVAFSPDGNQIAAGNSDGTVRVFDVRESSSDYDVPLMSVNQTVSSVTADGRAVRISGRRVAAQSVYAEGPATVFETPAGTTAVSGQLTDAGFRIGWRTQAGPPYRVGIQDGTGRQLLPDVVADDPDVKVYVDPSARWADVFGVGFDDLYDLTTGQKVGPGSLDVAPGGKLCARLTADRKAVLIGPLHGPPTISLPHANKDLTGFATFSPDGKRLAVMHQEGVTLWDTATGQSVAEIDRRTTPTVGDSVFTADSKRLLLTAVHGRFYNRVVHLQVWDTVTGRLLAEVAMPAAVSSVTVLGPVVGEVLAVEVHTKAARRGLESWKKLVAFDLTPPTPAADDRELARRRWLTRPDPGQHLSQGITLLADGQAYPAVVHLGRYFAQRPGDTTGPPLLARALVLLGRTAGAAELWGRLPEGTPAEERLRAGLAYLAGRPDIAAQILDRLAAAAGTPARRVLSYGMFTVGPTAITALAGVPMFAAADRDNAAVLAAAAAFTDGRLPDLPTTWHSARAAAAARGRPLPPLPEPDVYRSDSFRDFVRGTMWQEFADPKADKKRTLADYYSMLSDRAEVGPKNLVTLGPDEEDTAASIRLAAELLELEALAARLRRAATPREVAPPPR